MRRCSEVKMMRKKMCEIEGFGISRLRSNSRRAAQRFEKCSTVSAVKVADFAQQVKPGETVCFDESETACRNGYWVTSIHLVVNSGISQTCHTLFLQI